MNRNIDNLSEALLDHTSSLEKNSQARDSINESLQIITKTLQQLNSSMEKNIEKSCRQEECFSLKEEVKQWLKQFLILPIFCKKKQITKP